MAAWSIACRATPSPSCSSPWRASGLPGLSGFVGEFLVLVGAFKANTWVATLAATGLILGAAYALWLYRKIIFGELTKDSLKGILDMNRREIAVFLPLVLLSLWMGVYPGLLPRSHGRLGRQAGRRLPGSHQARPHGGVAVTRE